MAHLLKVVAYHSLGFWVGGPVGIRLVKVARRDLSLFANDVVEDALVIIQLFDVRPFDFRFGFRDGVLDNPVCYLAETQPGRLSGSNSECPD